MRGWYLQEKGRRELASTLPLTGRGQPPAGRPRQTPDVPAPGPRTPSPQGWGGSVPV